MFRFKTLTLLALSGAALSACVVTPYGYRYRPAYVAAAPAPVATVGNPNGDYVEQDEAVVDMAPPAAPYPEVVGVAPFPGAIWIGGYWGWNGGRHVWIGGRWEHPRPGFYWAPHRWVASGGHWHLVAGGWRRR